MTTFNQIKIGLKGYYTAFNMIFQRAYLKYLLFPLLLNIIIFWLGADLVFDLADKAQIYFSDWINIKEGDFWGASYIAEALSGFMKFLIYMAFLIVFVYVGGYIIVIILSPVFAILSEKVEKDIADDKVEYPFETKQFLKDILRGIVIAVRNLTIETSIMILIFFVSFIPVLGWFGSFIMFFVSAYFFGFSYMDYTNERQKRNIGESVQFIRKYKWVAITNGGLFSVSLVIPYCGIALSAFVAIISVMAATASVIELNNIEKANIQ
jgi:CysZ protein